MAEYLNPVVFADYSDPDVIRVGDTYYMTASSFHFTPGLPLLMSKDLVNWRLVGYAAKSIPLAQFNFPRHSKGIWAPSLRYHDGKFVIVVGLPDEGIFVTEATDFTGEWTPLKCIKEARGFIDPCPFWDADGKAYIVHAYAKSRIGFKSRLGIFEIDPKTMEAISDDEFIFIGDDSQPTIEGPKVYKRGAFYYIFAPAGGVKQGWQVELRSFSIKGPFSEQIVLEQGNSHINGPHQGGLVENPDGSAYFIHFQDRGVYGRVILLEPALWRGGWCVMGTAVKSEELIGEPVDKGYVPEISKGENLLGVSATECCDDFMNGKIGLQWQWQANVCESDYIAPSAESGLHLLCKNKNLGNLWNIPNVLSEKIVFEDFFAEIEMNVADLHDGERVGAIFLGGQYAGIEVHNTHGVYQFCYIESFTDPSDEELRMEKIIAIESGELKNKEKIKFVIDFASLPPNEKAVDTHSADAEKPSSGTCTFGAEVDGIMLKTAAKPYLCGGDHWVGGKIGFYAQGETGSVIVKRVKVSPKPKNW